ncbi:diacylglycerol kinase family protein [Methyloligella halotolerans]|nr:diacylglycerol kinase family protein [Methyloligella halotolerans]
MAARCLRRRTNSIPSSGVAWRPAPTVTPGPDRALEPIGPTWRRGGATRLRSFSFAVEGLAFVVRTQPNMRFHLVAATGAVLASTAVGLDAGEWLWVIAAIASVLAAECLNTAIEYLCDVVCPERSMAVKRAKDVAAGVVLIFAMTAVVVGAIIFIPKFIDPLSPKGFPTSSVLCRSGDAPTNANGLPGVR